MPMGPSELGQRAPYGSVTWVEPLAQLRIESLHRRVLFPESNCLSRASRSKMPPSMGASDVLDPKGELKEKTCAINLCWPQR
jgi:hypothetical protein